jgi:hypothetical protein
MRASNYQRILARHHNKLSIGIQANDIQKFNFNTVILHTKNNPKKSQQIIQTTWTPT